MSVIPYDVDAAIERACAARRTDGVQFVADDGGRGTTELAPGGEMECAIRSIAIGLELDYGLVHALFAGAIDGDPDRDQVPYEMFAGYLLSMGWRRTSNETEISVHDLPPGRYIVEYNMSCSGEMLHCSALVDGELRDIPPLGMPEDEARRLGLCDVGEWPLVGWWTPVAGPGGGPLSASGRAAGFDAMWLLKKAFVRDWTVVMAPRDVIEYGTCLWVPVVADNFPAGSLSSQWNSGSGFGGTVTVRPGGGLALSASGSGSAFADIATPLSAGHVKATGTWRAVCTFSTADGFGVGNPESFWMAITEGSGDEYYLVFYRGYAQLCFNGPGSVIAQTTLPVGPDYTLMLESDGEWIWGFVNGHLVGCFRRHDTTTEQLTTELRIDNNGTTAPSVSVNVSGVLVNALQPFLMPAATKGEYALPEGLAA